MSSTPNTHISAATGPLGRARRRSIACAVALTTSLGGMALLTPFAHAATTTTVTTWTGLVTAVAAGGSVTLGADIIAPSGDQLAIPATISTSLDLSGHTLSITQPAGYQAAVSVPAGATLTIDDTGGTTSAGTLTATGGFDGAGIGSGDNMSAGTIIVDSGTVTATSGIDAAAIGGGADGSGGEVDINGGTVTATSALDGGGAGIGGGVVGGSGLVEVNGGTVTATGGEAGAGIGAGYEASGGTVDISGGMVTATGGGGSAGIGSGTVGGAYGPPGTVDVSGGTVAATGGENAAGIGGGSGSSGGTVDISGGKVTATGGRDAAEGGGAGIGGGGNPPGYDEGAGAQVTIKSGAAVTASSPSGIAIGPGTNATTFGSLTNAGTLTIPADNTITVPGDVTVTNTGLIDLSGTLAGAGTITNTGTIAVETGGTVSDDGQGPTGTDLLVTHDNYTLTFDTNGGTGTTPGTIHAYAPTLHDAGLSLPAGPTPPTGTKFTGWWTAATVFVKSSETVGF